MGQPIESTERAMTAGLDVLAQAARALHGEPDLATVLSWTVEAAATLAGTTSTAVCLLPRDASPLWTVHPESEANFALLGDPRTLPVVEYVLRTGRPGIAPDLEADDPHLPPPSRVRRVVPLASLVAIPALDRDGQLTGLIFAGWEAAGEVATDTVGALVALAAHLGVAVDNHATLERMAEEEARGKEVVHRLQEAVRPPAPIVPSTELGVHYVAADPSAPTGGDLYDWIVLPSGDVHLCVVDVMGKGVEATKHALAVTHALRTLAVDGEPIANIVAKADVLVTAQNPDLVATLLVARYTPSTGHLILAGAGHPPALLVHDGDVAELTAPGIPIGWPGAGSHGVIELTLERSDTLILYTDGLIEATKDILYGLESLAKAARATAGYPATSLARVLVERQLADAARHDDSLALVLRRRSAPALALSHVLAPFVHQFSPTAAAVPVARHLLHDWLVRVPVDPNAVDALLLVASELASNAVRHASGAPGSVRLEAWVEGDGVVIEASDDGGGPPFVVDLGPDDLPDPEAEQGRGLFLVRELADELETRAESRRTIVRAVKHAVTGSEAEPAMATTSTV